jgi:hypothetical protein
MRHRICPDDLRDSGEIPVLRQANSHRQEPGQSRDQER